MAFDFNDRNDSQCDGTAPVFTDPLASTDLSRTDIADYLARSNYDPDKARALATHETLTNLGVHPDIAARVAACRSPVVPAVPSSLIGARPQVQPATPVVHVAPKPTADALNADCSGKTKGSEC